MGVWVNQTRQGWGLAEGSESKREGWGFPDTPKTVCKVQYSLAVISPPALGAVQTTHAPEFYFR
jgi:hypothetical protein